MKMRITLMVMALLSWSALAQADQMVYNANNEFSLASNPDGVWTYGTTSFADVYAGSGVMDTYENWTTRPGSDGADIDAWSLSGYPYDPSVTHNGSDSPVAAFGFTWGVNNIGLDSYVGASIIQWKAPRAGTVVARVTFSATPVIAYEGFNGDEVKSQSNSSGTEWSNTFVVNAGDCIQFATAGGAGAVTMFHETVTYVPEPSTVVLAGSGLFGLLAYAWRKRT